MSATRSTLTRSLGMAILSMALLSCALVMSFEDYDLSGSPTARTLYGVDVTIEGLERDAQVLLSLKGTESGPFPNGRFELPPRVAEGETFAMSATSPAHECAVVRADPPAVGKAAEATVHCKSKDASLRSLTAAGATVSPAFHTGRSDYSIAAPLLATLITPVLLTAITESPNATVTARARRADDAGELSLVSGILTVAPRRFILNGFDLTVTARAGNTRGYGFASSAPTFFKPASGAGSPNFGSAVAIDGDTLAVGAPADHNGGGGVSTEPNQDAGAVMRSGAVYIFRRSAAGWAQTAYVKAASPTEDADFGASIALSGDTLVVGARGRTGSSQAAAHVFRRVGEVWTLEARLDAPPVMTLTQPGPAVAIDRDTLIFGAEAEGSFAGAAYVFQRTGTTWTQQTRLSASNARTLAYFGVSVAIDGDLAVVGARRESSNATGIDGDETNTAAQDAGAAYVFRRNGSTWSQEVYLKPSITRDGAYFGASVAVSKDTVVVGSDGESSGATGVDGDQNASSAMPSAGAAYVFQRSGPTWTQQAYLKASNTHSNARLGCSVAIEGDTVVAGAVSESSKSDGIDGDQTPGSANGAGAAYLFHRTAGKWAPLAYVKASNTRADARFGVAVALDGDALVVGSSKESSDAAGINGDPLSSGTARGAAYLY